MRLIGALTQVLNIYLLSRYLTEKTFGFWFIIQSLITLFSLFDFGTTSTLQNYLVKKNNLEGKALFFSFTNIYLLLGFPLALAITLIPVENLLGFYAGKQMIIALILTCHLRLAFQTAKAGFNAEFKTFNYSIIESIGLLISTGIISILITYSAKETMIFHGYFLSLLIGPLIGFFYYLYLKEWSLCWIPIKVQLNLIRSVIQPFTGLWALNLLYIGIFSIDTFLIWYLFDLETVSYFSVFNKIYSMVLLITLPITTASWTPLASSFHNEDFEWIKQTMKKIIVLSGILILSIGFTLLVTHSWIFKCWIAKSYNDYTLCILLWVCVALISIQSLLSTYLNAIELHKQQIPIGLIALCLNAALSIFLGKIFGIHGIVAATIIAIVPMILVNASYAFSSLQDRKFLHKL